MKPKYFLMALFALALYFLYILYKPFLMSIIVASLLAISTSNIQSRFEALFRSKFLAATLSTILLLLMLFAPLSYTLTMLTANVNNLDPQAIDTMFQKLILFIDNTPPILEPVKQYAHSYLDELSVSNMASNALTIAGKVGIYSASFVKSSFLIIIFYFFAQYYGRAISGFLKRVIQLQKQDATLLGFEITSVMSVVFYSIIVTAIFEGALFGIAISFMGYDGLLYGIIYGFASLIPVIGGALMWIPFVLYEFTQGNIESAIFIALYSIVVISIIADTFVKPMIIKYINTKMASIDAKLNEMIIFFAIIAGLTTFGFWGMIIGPAITAFFLSLLKIVELHQRKKELD
ncbi:MAG: AI-2E family transporter [Campylobacterota bacterium]|nr:AI-2E family transporter [Campylobacterota bacterium]